MVTKKLLPLITEDWPHMDRNPRYGHMIQQRAKIIKKLRAWQAQLDLILSMIDLKSDPRVVELAHGTGLFLLELANRGFNTIGLEFDPLFCQLTNDVSEYFGFDVRSVCGDACAIPFKDNFFDVVMSTSFFEHVYDIDLTLKEQIRILKPGGLLLIRDGNFLNPKSLLDLLILYPIRSRGRFGGLRWIFRKKRVQQNLYGFLSQGRDEDFKSIFWWRRKIKRVKGLDPLIVTTTGSYTHKKLPKILYPFIGYCLVCARKASAG